MIIGKQFNGAKIIGITRDVYIGYTQDNLGNSIVFELDVILSRPIKRIDGMTHKIKLYNIVGCSPLFLSNRLTDTKPRIYHK